MILQIATAVLGFYSICLTTGVFVVARRTYRARKMGEGFIATGMTVETMNEVETMNDEPATDEESRRWFRNDISCALGDAVEILAEAEKRGRRTDCLRQVVAGYRGALQNICAEDAEILKDPTIVFEEPSCAACGAYGFDKPLGHEGDCSRSGNT